MEVSFVPIMMAVAPGPVLRFVALSGLRGTNCLRQELARWSHAFESLKGKNGFIIFMKAGYLMLGREQVSVSKSRKGDFLTWL